MPKMQPDANSKPIPALKPGDAATVNGTSSAFTSTIIRITAAADALYGISPTATVSLPAGVVEYVRVDVGDTITTDSAVNVSEMS